MATTQLAKAAVPEFHSLATVEARYKALVAKRETISRTLMPANAQPAQVDAFLLLCSRYDLDPFIGEAYAFPKPGNGIGFMPGYRAYLRCAQQHPDFEYLKFGVVNRGEVCTVNPITGEVKHEMGMDDGDPIACWWQLKRRSQERPMAGRVLMKQVGRGTPAWKDNPMQMLRKAALQEACSICLSGLAVPAPEIDGDEDIIDVASSELQADAETGEILIDASAGVEGTVASEPEAPAEAITVEIIDEPARPSARELPAMFQFSAEQGDLIRARQARVSLKDSYVVELLNQAWLKGLDEQGAVDFIGAQVKSMLGEPA